MKDRKPENDRMKSKRLGKLEKRLRKIRRDVRIRVWVASKWREIKDWARNW